MIDEAVRCNAQNPGPFWYCMYNHPIATGTANSFLALRLLQLQVLEKRTGSLRTMFVMYEIIFAVWMTDL